MVPLDSLEEDLKETKDFRTSLELLSVLNSVVKHENVWVLFRWDQANPAETSYADSTFKTFESSKSVRKSLVLSNLP